MNFLKKFFGEKEIVEIKTTLEDLPNLLQKKFVEEFNDLELSSAKTMSEIKFLYEKALQQVSNLQKKEIEETDTRFSRAATTSKKQIESQLNRALEKINPNNISNNFDDVRAYSNNSQIVLINEINSFRKNIVYTSVYLKEEMRALGQTLQEIIDKLVFLNQQFGEKKELLEFEKIKKRISIIQEHERELKNIDSFIIEQNKKISDLNNEIIINEQKIIKIKKSLDAKKLIELEEEEKSINQKKYQLGVEFTSMISTIEKPLQRFSALVKNKKWLLDEELSRVLDEYNTNALLAIKKDVNGKKFKEVLIEVKKAILEEKIELKYKEKEKRINSINNLIEYDFFGNIFWELNNLQKKLNEVDNEIKNNLVNKNIENIEAHKKELESEKTQLVDQTKIQEKQKEKLLEQINSEKEKIVLFSEKIFGKKIVLKQD